MTILGRFRRLFERGSKTVGAGKPVSPEAGWQLPGEVSPPSGIAARFLPSADPEIFNRRYRAALGSRSPVLDDLTPDQSGLKQADPSAVTLVAERLGEVLPSGIELTTSSKPDNPDDEEPLHTAGPREFEFFATPANPIAFQTTTEVFSQFDAKDDFDGLLTFEAEDTPETFRPPDADDGASKVHVPFVNLARDVGSGHGEDWDIDLSSAQITGDGIGSVTTTAPADGLDGNFLTVSSTGRRSTKRAVIQTGTRLSIDREACDAWANETLAKGWCSFADVDRLVAQCGGDGDVEELHINLQRNLEAAGIELVDDASSLLFGQLAFVSNLGPDDLADAVEAACTRSTRLPGLERFTLNKADERELLELMARARQELHLGILSSALVVATILEVIKDVRTGSRRLGSVTLRTASASSSMHDEMSDFLAAAEVLVAWQNAGRVMDGKRRREALAALEALDLSLAFYMELALKIKRHEPVTEPTIDLANLISIHEASTEQLVQKHLPYARRFSARNVSEGEEPEDVFQVALIGLLLSTRRFDPQRGHRFLIYATYWMRQAITRWRADEGKAIRVPVHRHEKLSQLDRALNRIDTRVGGFVSDRQLADDLAWTPDDVQRLRSIPREPVYPDGSEDWDDLLSDERLADPFDHVDTNRIVEDMLAQLPVRQADVIRRRFGIGRDTDMTLEEVGQVYGVTRERIRQIEAKGLRFLRHPERVRRLKSLSGG